MRLLTSLPIPCALATALLLAGPPPALAQQQAKPQPEAPMPAVRTGYVVMDLKSGQVLAAERARETFIPASVAKVPSMIGILLQAAPDHRFATTLTATGPIKNGIVQGDLVLVGGGDPSLDIDAFEEMVATLKKQGIKGVKGRFLYDASALPTLRALEETQPDDVPYNPGLSGLSMSYNRFRIGWDKQGNPRGLEQPLELYTEALPKTLEKTETSLPVRNTALYAARTFVWVAARNGLTLPKPEAAPKAASAPSGKGNPSPASGPGIVLARHLSAPLSEILKAAVYHSNNVATETLALAVTGAKTLPQASDQLRKLVQDAIPSVSWAGLVLPNASGLSPDARMTPGQCAALARFSGANIIKDQPLKPYIPGLMTEPFAVPDGYLNSPATLRGKSGTINYGRALAGVFTAKSGRELAYCVMSDDQAARDRYDAVPFDQRRDDAVREPARAWLKAARAAEATLIRGWIDSL